MRANNKNSVNIVDLFFYLLSNWYWFAISLVICVGVAYYNYSCKQHMFRSDATIIIKDPSNTRTTVQLGTYSNLINHVSMSNEILQLQSKALMKDAVCALDADIDYLVTDRLRVVELYNLSPVRLYLQRQEADLASFQIRIRPVDENSILVAEETAAPKMVTLGDTVTVCGFHAVFKPTAEYGNYYGKDVTVRKKSSADAARAYLSRLKVLQTEEDGSILQLTLLDYAFRRADDMLNMLVEKYNEDALREKNRIAVNTAAFINERLIIIQEELGSVEEDIAKFKREEKIMDVETAAADYLSQSKGYNSEIVDLETRIGMAQFLKDYLLSSFRTYETVPVNTGLDDVNIDASVRAYNNAIRERERLVKAGSESSPAVKQKENELYSLREDILGFIDNKISTLQRQKRSLADREKESLRKFTTMPTKARELLSIERQQKIKESLYMFLLNKREENALTQSMADNNARMIDAASSSWTPVYPSRNKTLLLAILLGLLIPGSILILRLLLDTCINSRKDIEEGTDMPFLAEIPFSREKRQAKKSPNSKPSLAYNNASSKQFIEAMRLMCANIDYMKPEGCSNPVLLTTSFAVSAGKTFITTNVAACLADAKKRVVLVDMDLRKRTLSNYFSLKHGVQGLSNYIYDDSLKLEDILHKDVLKGVDLIPAGHIPPNPAELLGRSRLDELIALLKKEYDYILLDGVPVNIVADTMIVQRILDMNLFIIRHGKVDRRALPELDRFYSDGRLKNPSIILNGGKINKGIGSRYGYDYGYGYGYGYAYGYGDKEK